MDPLAKAAEARIRAAIEAGELENLPGRGKPLVFEDDSSVPADLRMGFRILKRANVLPEELELRKEVLTLDSLIAACENPDEAKALVATRNAKQLRYRLLEERRLHGPAMRRYAGRIRRRLGASR
jgi:hypothetical protein